MSASRYATPSETRLVSGHYVCPGLGRYSYTQWRPPTGFVNGNGRSFRYNPSSLACISSLLIDLSFFGPTPGNCAHFP